MSRFWMENISAMFIASIAGSRGWKIERKRTTKKWLSCCNVNWKVAIIGRRWMPVRAAKDADERPENMHDEREDFQAKRFSRFYFL